jgi:hypothetical protein
MSLKWAAQGRGGGGGLLISRGADEEVSQIGPRRLPIESAVLRERGKGLKESLKFGVAPLVLALVQKVLAHATDHSSKVRWGTDGSHSPRRDIGEAPGLVCGHGSRLTAGIRRHLGRQRLRFATFDHEPVSHSGPFRGIPQQRARTGRRQVQTAGT